MLINVMHQLLFFLVLWFGHSVTVDNSHIQYITRFHAKLTTRGASKSVWYNVDDFEAVISRFTKKQIYLDFHKRVRQTYHGLICFSVVSV